jgi:uncharacterized membrane protein
MGRRKMLQIIDKNRVTSAIAAAERMTSGEISVSIAPIFWGNIETAARKTFARLGMTQTRERNGVLIFVVPARRKFFVLGDSGIHAKVGPEFWQNVAAHLSEHFRSGNFTEGLVRAINEIGEQLAAHFPFVAATDTNELSDDIDYWV